jgi:multidrug resistance efflux pump
MIDSFRAFMPSRNLRIALYCFALAALVVVVSSACNSGGSGGDDGEARGIVVVNSPATGEVRRVLVSEGMTIDEGSPVVEIVVRTEAQAATPQVAEDPVTRAGQTIQSSESEVEAARAEVVRFEVEVQRLTPLVASGEATQGQLDGARADYDRAQQRLQRAQSAAQSAQVGLISARQQSQSQTPAAAATPQEQIVVANASAAGRVSAVSAKVGDRVKTGQPLATLRTGQR